MLSHNPTLYQNVHCFTFFVLFLYETWWWSKYRIETWSLTSTIKHELCLDQICVCIEWQWLQNGMTIAKTKQKIRKCYQWTLINFHLLDTSAAISLRLDLLQHVLTSLEINLKGHSWVMVSWSLWLFSYSLACEEISCDSVLTVLKHWDI